MADPDTDQGRKDAPIQLTLNSKWKKVSIEELRRTSLMAPRQIKLSELFRTQQQKEEMEQRAKEVRRHVTHATAPRPQPTRTEQY